MFFFDYEVVYWDEFDEAVMMARGITVGEDVADATERLMSYYGRNEISEIVIKYKNDAEDVLELNKRKYEMKEQ